MSSAKYEVKSEKLPGTEAESKPLGKIGNTSWHFFHYTNSDHLSVGVECNRNLFSNLWLCDATVEISFCSSSSDTPLKIEKMRHTFKDLDEKKCEFKKFLKIDTEEVKELWNVENGSGGHKLEFKISIEIHSTVGLKGKDVKEEFDQPNEPITDVMLLVENKKVYFTKQELAMHSKYFHNLFFSNPEDIDKKEFKLDDDVKYDHFVDLLRHISPPVQQFDEKTLKQILELAARFQMWKVNDKAEAWLCTTDKVYLYDKLKYAGDYKMNTLQDHLVDEMDMHDIMDVEGKSDFDQLTPETVRFLFEQLVKHVYESRS